MAKRFITFSFGHNSFAFILVRGFIIATSNKQMGVWEPELTIRSYKKQYELAEKLVSNSKTKSRRSNTVKLAQKKKIGNKL